MDPVQAAAKKALTASERVEAKPGTTTAEVAKVDLPPQKGDVSEMDRTLVAGALKLPGGPYADDSFEEWLLRGMGRSTPRVP